MSRRSSSDAPAPRPAERAVVLPLLVVGVLLSLLVLALVSVEREWLAGGSTTLQLSMPLGSGGDVRPAGPRLSATAERLLAEPAPPQAELDARSADGDASVSGAPGRAEPNVEGATWTAIAATPALIRPGTIALVPPVSNAATGGISAPAVSRSAAAGGAEPRSFDPDAAQPRLVSFENAARASRGAGAAPPASAGPQWSRRSPGPGASRATMTTPQLGVSPESGGGVRPAERRPWLLGATGASPAGPVLPRAEVDARSADVDASVAGARGQAEANVEGATRSGFVQVPASLWLGAIERVPPDSSTSAAGLSGSPAPASAAAGGKEPRSPGPEAVKPELSSLEDAARALRHVAAAPPASGGRRAPERSPGPGDSWAATTMPAFEDHDRAGPVSVPSRSDSKGIRVFIHHDAASAGDAALARRLADHLRQEGFVIADIRPVDLRIAAPSVRYFFARDRSDSRLLVEELNRFFDAASNRAPARASDFTHYAPKPRIGNVEIWLSTS